MMSTRRKWCNLFSGVAIVSGGVGLGGYLSTLAADLAKEKIMTYYNTLVNNPIFFANMMVSKTTFHNISILLSDGTMAAEPTAIIQAIPDEIADLASNSVWVLTALAIIATLGAVAFINFAIDSCRKTTNIPSDDAEEHFLENDTVDIALANSRNSTSRT